MESQEEIKNQAYEESNILYDSDKLMVVEPETFTATKYFGPQYVSDRYSSTFRDGDLYFIILKDSSITPLPTYTIFKPKSGGKTILLDSEIFDITSKEMINRLPEVKNILEPLIGYSNTYTALKKLSQGEIVEDLPDIDDLIYQVKIDRNKPSRSRIILRFDSDEDYFKLFEVNDDDIWYFNNIFSRYDSFEFEDSYYTTESWKDGYIMREFNSDNLSKVMEIMKLLNPKIKNLNSDDSFIKASKTLDETFENEVDYILSEYSSLINDCKLQQAKKEIINAFCNRFEDVGILKMDCFWRYFTSPTLLLRIYNLVGDKTLDIYELLKTYAHSEYGDMSGWGENYYETQCYSEFFDEENYQNYVSSKLDDMLEKIQESDMFVDLDEYRKIMDEIISKYPIGQTFKLPKNSDANFTIEEVNPSTNKITLVYSNYKGLTGKREKRSLNREEFYNFLYHPELFESHKRK